MKLSFEHLLIENFKAFVGKHEIKLGQPGLHYMRGRNLIEPRLGSNGASKSSVWDALCWCLYGRTPDGLKNPDVQPWYGDAQTFVEVELFVGKDKHIVTRTIAPNKLLLDGCSVGQAQVDELIGMNVDTFCNTILLGQGQPLFFDLKPAAKMDLFSSVLRLDRWDGYAKEASDWAAELISNNRALGAEGLLLRQQYEQIKRDLTSAEDSAKFWDRGIKIERDEHEKQLKELTKQQKHLQKERDAADLAYDSAETEVRHLKGQDRKIGGDLKLAERDYDKLTLLLQAARDATIALDAELKLTDKNKGGTCPTCGQSVSGKHLAKHRKEMERQYNTLMDKLDAGIPKEIEKKLTWARKRLADNNQRLIEFQDKASKARDTLDSITPQIAEVNAKIGAANDVLKRADAIANPYDEIIHRLKGLLKSVGRKLDDIEDDLDKNEKLLPKVEFWTKGFKDVRLYVLKEVLDEIEITANSMLEEIGLIDWEIQFDIEKETKSGTIQHGLTVRILSPDSPEAVRWESWSGGERQRLRLIGALALSEVLLNHAGVNPDLEILDEPTQHLSAEGVQDLCEYLADRAEGLGKMIVYIDHAAVESSRFTLVMTVSKDRDGAWIS